MQTIPICSAAPNIFSDFPPNMSGFPPKSYGNEPITNKIKNVMYTIPNLHINHVNIIMILCKLDGVSPVDHIPSTNFFFT